MKENIKNFFKVAQDTTSAINPIYKRNFREVLKLIPVIGSWIDANTMGAIEDTILAERLENLETSCSRALSIDDGVQLYTEVVNINSIIFVILLTHMHEMTHSQQKMATDIGSLLAIAHEDRKKIHPHPNFRFVTISGPSAVGKDCILDLILYCKARAQTPIEALTKFTTRPKRIVDSKYYDFITEEQFDALERSGNIIFPYYKRNARYGFDRTHLMSAAREKQVLFSIFTHFESLPADRQFLRDHGIQHVAILMKGDRDSLFVRSDERPLKRQDIQERKKSIEVDLQFIADNPRLIENCFDLSVDNGDAYAKHNCYNSIVRCVGLPEMVISGDLL